VSVKTGRTGALLLRSFGAVMLGCGLVAGFAGALSLYAGAPEAPRVAKTQIIAFPESEQALNQMLSAIAPASGDKK